VPSLGEHFARLRQMLGVCSRPGGSQEEVNLSIHLFVQVRVQCLVSGLAYAEASADSL